MTQAPTERLSLRQRLEQERGRVWVVGHRGAMGHRPENTFASFEYGLEVGADWIELDVHLTHDGALAVIHDESVDRTTDGHGLVRDHSLAELKLLDAGSWFGPAYAGERIPTLAEVLEWARQRNTVVDIEIKNAPISYPGIEDAVVTALDATGMTEQVIVISFDHAAVARVKSLDARVATGVLYAGRPVDGGVNLAHQANADAVLPHWAHVTSADVQVAHAAGLSVAPWATSDPQVLRHLIAAGVDGIGTNHPDVLRQILDERLDSAPIHPQGESPQVGKRLDPAPIHPKGQSPQVGERLDPAPSHPQGESPQVGERLDPAPSHPKGQSPQVGERLDPAPIHPKGQSPQVGKRLDPAPIPPKGQSPQVGERLDPASAHPEGAERQVSQQLDPATLIPKGVSLGSSGDEVGAAGSQR